MSKKMRIPFGTISIPQKSKKLINEILSSERVSSGKYVRQFEHAFADLIGVKESVAVSSGTDAVALALSVLYDFGAQRGDEIILPALSFAATGNAVLQAGFTPIFVDINLNTLTIDATQIEKNITPKTRAIMPVHLMGKPAEMDTIQALAHKHNLFVIEDAAEAHGSLYKGKKIGSIGDLTAFSLYVAHIISTGEGGVVTTNNETYARILRSLRSHGRACTCQECKLNINSQYCDERFNTPNGKDLRFYFERIGFSSKMNELEAAIGLGILDDYDTILEKRRRNFLYMLDAFKRFHPFLATIKEDPHEVIGPHAIPIIIQQNASFSRAHLTNYLETHGIETRTLFSSMPTQCPGFSYLGYTFGEFPNAEYIGTHGLHIGVHQNLNSAHMDYIIQTIETFLKKYRKE